MDRYDSIVIGAGHNGLVCAAYLAKAGQQVLVVESAATPGGLAAGHEMYDGFRASVAHTVSHFPKTIADDLGLAGPGSPLDTPPLSTIGLGPDGEHVVVGASGATGVAAADADAYRDFTARMSRFAEALAPFWLETMPRIGSKGLSDIMTFARLGFRLRRLGKQDLHEFLRIATLPVRDLMDETFSDDRLKAALGWDGLIGSKFAPRSPNGAVLAMLYRRAGNPAGLHSIPAGGVNAFAVALATAAETAGTSIRYESKVSRIVIDSSRDGLAATGVELEGGERILASRVISAADPRSTLLGLVGVKYLDIGFTNRIRRLRGDGLVAKLHLALDGVPEFAGLDSPAGRMLIAPDLDAIEFAFDDAKYGQSPTEPVMEIVVPSLTNPDLAPAGKHLLSAHVMYVPYKLKGGWTDGEKDALCNRVIDTLERYAPRIREQILRHELLTPADLEAQYGCSGGHWHHGDIAIDQMLMMRPTYDAAQYATPIPGLYLCSAGSHPGGDITGAAGHNAAQEILK